MKRYLEQYVISLYVAFRTCMCYGLRKAFRCHIMPGFPPWAASAAPRPPSRRSRKHRLPSAQTMYACRDLRIPPSHCQRRRPPLLALLRLAANLHGSLESVLCPLAHRWLGSFQRAPLRSFAGMVSQLLGSCSRYCLQARGHSPQASHFHAVQSHRCLRWAGRWFVRAGWADTAEAGCR